MSKINKPVQKFCIVCGSPTELKIPEGDNRKRAVCTVCGHIHYQNPKVVSGCILEWEDKIFYVKEQLNQEVGTGHFLPVFLKIMRLSLRVR